MTAEPAPSASKGCQYHNPWAKKSWFLQFADGKLEAQYSEYTKQHTNRVRQAHHVLELSLLVAAGIFMFIGSMKPPALIFRMNNVLSWAYVLVFNRCYERFPHRISLSAAAYVWGFHHILYQSLAHSRAVELCRLFGVLSNEQAAEMRAEEMDDEGYQLLFSSLAVFSLAMFARMPLSSFFSFAVLAPTIFAVQLVTLGTWLSVASAVKHIVVYCLICILACLGAYQVELDFRHIFLQEAELTEELAREREWHSCFGRILASNFDYSATLSQDLTLAGDHRLNAMLGAVVPTSVHIFDLAHGDSEKQRIQKFFESLHDQVVGSPNACHGPERFSFSMGVDAVMEVDMQVLWVPGKVQGSACGDAESPLLSENLGTKRPWPVGNLWACFRQRQLEEMRWTTGQEKQRSASKSLPGSSERVRDTEILLTYPDFIVEFEAGSPRFTIFQTSPGSPFENPMRQAPDLMDWLPMRYSEQFSVWVEESVTDAPDDKHSLSASSFGPFVLQPPCSDWHGVRVQRAVLEIPEYNQDEADLPVKLRLMGVCRRPRKKTDMEPHPRRHRRKFVAAEVVAEENEGASEEDVGDGDTNSEHSASVVSSATDLTDDSSLVSGSTSLRQRTPTHC